LVELKRETRKKIKRNSSRNAFYPREDSFSSDKDDDSDSYFEGVLFMTLKNAKGD
jgi:hypothetical protein